MINETYSKKVKKILYGGDYNPEQWPKEVWAEDMRLFKEAGIDCVTLNVFSWAALQPNEHTYCFDRLDEIIETVSRHGLSIILATSTAAHPAWMARKYPEVLRTEYNGVRRKFGGRHNSCPNSPIYQKYSILLAQKLAQRYGHLPNLVAWHISNEYGGECYCENCEKAFRQWLKKKYKNIETLNRYWNTSFWGHTFYDWEEIVSPNLQSECFETTDSLRHTMFQGISLDYQRFLSDSMLANYMAEYRVIKTETPDIPVTTNFMGFYKPLDYQKWGPALDFASWDNYPSIEDTYPDIAMRHDLARGLKEGAPFVLMEQTPSVTNWLPYNSLKRPGIMRLLSYQAIAHGADALLFFQMRRSIGACEKFHGAVIDHSGRSDTRVFQEVSSLGQELLSLGDTLLGARTPSETALVVAWDNWWALEFSAGPSRDLNYMSEIQKYYQALCQQNIPVDIISIKEDLSKYKMVIAPLLYMVKGSYDEKIRYYVKNGGIFVTTFFSGIVEEHDLVMSGGHPGNLRDILGIWVEESDALPPDKENSFIWNGKSYLARLLCDILHTESAHSLAEYTRDFYAGFPALTRNDFGRGSAFYAACASDSNFYSDFVSYLADQANVSRLWEPLKDVEICARDKNDSRYLFFLNHGDTPKKICPPQNGLLLLGEQISPDQQEINLPAKEVCIFKIT